MEIFLFLQNPAMNFIQSSGWGRKLSLSFIGLLESSSVWLNLDTTWSADLFDLELQ